MVGTQLLFYTPVSRVHQAQKKEISRTRGPVSRLLSERLRLGGPNETMIGSNHVPGTKDSEFFYPSVLPPLISDFPNAFTLFTDLCRSFTPQMRVLITAVALIALVQGMLS